MVILASDVSTASPGYRPLVRRADVEDVAVALAVTALGQVDVWAPDVFSTNLAGPRWLIALFYTIAGLALIWRRRRPFVAFCVVAGVFAVQAILIGASEGNGALIPAVVATYSVAANGTRREAFLALALLVPMAAIRELRNPDNVDLGATANAIAWDLVIVAAWLLGMYLHTRRLYVRELADRTAHAEREKEERVATAALEERERIAREMHDILAHSISVIVVQAEAAEEMLDRRPERVRNSLQKIQRTGREALVELRRTLGALRDPGKGDLVPQPGLAAVPALAADLESAGLPVRLTINGNVDDLPPGIDLAAYRIVQEALTNALKHAGATEATVRIACEPGAVHVEVRDDGTSRPDSRSDGAGHGLVGMRERAVLYGGELDAGPVETGGFVVHARIPRRGSA